MIYAEKGKNESQYVSVNTLIQPRKKYNRIGTFSPDTTEEEKEQTPVTGAPLSTMPDDATEERKEVKQQTDSGRQDQLPASAEQDHTEKIGRQVYENWFIMWVKKSNNAIKKARALRQEIWEKDPIEFAEKYDLFQKGGRDVFGSEYQEVVDLREYSLAIIRTAPEILTWIEVQIMNNHEPTVEEINHKAAEIAGVKQNNNIAAEFTGKHPAAEFMRRVAFNNLFKDQFSVLKNAVRGRGIKTNSQLNLEQRDEMAQEAGGSDAARVQASLVMMGYDLGEYGPRGDGIDGKPGGMTKRALGEFQQAVGLKSTGEMEPQTIAALDLAVQASLKKADIEKIGEALGYYDLVWPTQSRRITSPFGPRIHPITGEEESFHRGLDIGPIEARVEGDKIVSAVDGIVITSAFQKKGAGYYLTIESFYAGQRMRTLYMHLQKNSMVVKQGDSVSSGQHIANMGNTGASTAAHLHFEIRVFEGGEWVRKDPMSWNYRYE